MSSDELLELPDLQEKQKEAQHFFDKTARNMNETSFYEKKKVMLKLIKQSSPIYELVEYIMKNDKELITNKEQRNPLAIISAIIEHVPDRYLENYLSVIVQKVIKRLCDDPISYADVQLATHGIIMNLYNIDCLPAYDWQKKILAIMLEYRIGPPKRVFLQENVDI